MEFIGLIALGLFAGYAAATLGIGGGIIFVPVLVSLFAFGQLEAQATSLAIILPTAIIATYAHARADRVAWKVAYVTGGPKIVFAFLGALAARSMDEVVLSKLFAVLLAALAIRMTRRAWALRSETGAVDRGGDLSA